MEEYSEIFHFIWKQGGPVKLKKLKEIFNQVINLQDVLEGNKRLFWVSKITKSDWEVRAKIPDVELCGLYLKGVCYDWNCSALHMCKSFLLSRKSCKGSCKKGLSHSIKDSHNEKVLGALALDDSIMTLLRSSFPRLCDSFQVSGKCGKYFCGYLHLCIFYVQGKCKKECQFGARLGLSKKEVHGLTSAHNMKVFSTFGLFREKRDVFLTKILFHSKSEEDNPVMEFSDFSSDFISLREKTSPSVKVSVNNESLATASFPISRSLCNELKDPDLITSMKTRDLDFYVTSICAFDDYGIELNEEIAIIKPSVADISKFILSNFKEGYCLLNAEGLQSLFPENSGEDILKWFEGRQRYFRISEGKNELKRVYPCFVDVEPCTSYWGKDAAAKCMKDKCGKFHICYRLITGEIHNHNSCTQNHSFEDKAVMQLIKCNKLESYTDDQLLALLQNRLPFVCSNYQTGSCKEGERHCSMLHICEGFVTKSCAKMEDICGLCHETALTSNQAERIANEFHIPLPNLQNLVLIKSTKQKAGVTNFKGNLCSFLNISEK